MLPTAPRQPTVSIIVPARNEAKNLEIVLPLLPDVHEIIVVDGHSVDGTPEVARRVRPSVDVITQTRKGKGNALVCGFERATGDIIVMFDADGSADAEEIPRFIDALIGGADVSKGSRFMDGGSSEDITFHRQLGNRLLNGLTNVLLGTRYSDLCYGYNAFWRRILPSLDLPAADIPGADGQMLWGDGFEIETLLNCRFAENRLNVVEVPSVELLRIHGESNLNAVSDGLRVLRTVLDERMNRWGRRRVSRPTFAPVQERAVMTPPSPAPARVEEPFGAIG
ncbi:MAG TPA: glycosyltransferase family 2 protein [Microbacterium sp.]|uniref:glycosyltransferase family 2 protein n=1 Tax=Microbacterium sp. TaxID=51671 RepID=UPI002BC857EC|nr:glycosyltransferase family 2 protein [Microbacterium sp.]HWI31428.1 glycosyltransferase family 2 protein [Microbacterium sp.]